MIVEIRTWLVGLGIQSEDDMSFTQKAYMENRQTSIQLRFLLARKVYTDMVS